MNELMRFILFFVKLDNFIFNLKSLNNIMEREKPIELY